MITPVSATVPTVVFTPSGAGVPHAVLFNNGPGTVWLGGSAVSAGAPTTIALPPLGKLRLPNMAAGGTIWAVSGFEQVSPRGTVITATTALGGTTLTTAAGGTFFTAGMWLVVEPGTPRQEVAQVNGSNAGSVFTNGPLTYSHGTAATFAQLTATPTVLTTSFVGAT